ncbi:MAG: chromosome partitioning protein ParB [Lysobacterales bacterium 69-70]|nr:ParB/RepB/Spo0J family partition protein [Xanthomonadaceae bacterium]ODU35510.1 MAG: chromosome partitioning protein ParB [Xanthomonadaceae bacterium SCN 69-320]ODV16756.1 MAG: chromosome partitioning protein ParB [Xanthomonadaceae bacterium SCN 69-25]OJY96653.1 MAG: chromosome partitioning protein ParB [Xanthomonadales bacterium 69-70]
MSAAKKRGLGRGLDALLGSLEPETAETGEGGGSELRQIAVGKIFPGKYQPRQAIDPEKLEELAASIRAQGVIEPIVVRASGDRYELIAGERRWRATQLAGLAEIPALVRDVDDRAVVAIALIENIQREELTPLEESQALKRLIDEFDLTHQQVAEAVGRSRAAVSNLLRLMELPAEIKQLLEQKKLDMGHARALLTLPEALAIGLARRAAEHGWSVRELEDAARAAQSEPQAVSAKPAKTVRDPNVESLERDLSERIGARVAINHSRNGRGKLTIRYHSLEELDGILARIK